ncbi:hypothetical protein [Bradyrhizobium sp. CCBAU 45384]|uniref:hypothetical protein n=1 Tax=Bradyrhizobium sp. CCBAU 45384 TaxID=858428 RepID=UPI002304F80B|nr:hypothetical protein [Bradyrhizobium sp. CCBAU 45384]MDA9411875.1 hypothetical protein [Bradyrhizobium sp. CCBAU 45384]
MSQQHTEFYLWFVAALRVIDRQRWRRRGEKLLNVDPGDLDLVDNPELAESDLCYIEDLVSKAMRDKVAELRAKADEIECAARVFEGKAAGRRFAVKTAALTEWNDIVDAFAREVLANMNVQQEAA